MSGVCERCVYVGVVVMRVCMYVSTWSLDVSVYVTL